MKTDTSTKITETSERNIIAKHSPRYLGLSMVEFIETKRHHDTNEGMVRLYCTQFPDVWNFQIRAFQPLLQDHIPNPKLKRRNLIATVSLTLDELEEMVRLARESVTKKATS